MTKTSCYDEVVQAVHFSKQEDFNMLFSKAILSLVASTSIFSGAQGFNHVQPSETIQKNVYVTQDPNQINNLVDNWIHNMGVVKYSSNTTKTQTTPTVQKQVTQPAAPKTVQQQPTQMVTAKPVSTQTSTTTTSTQASNTLSAYEQKVVDLTNQERAKNGLPALKVDATLSKMAHEKSRDMSANNYFSHTSPTYGSPFDMMKTFGITYTYAGENIAMGQKTPEEVVNAWMNSAGHRANILNSHYTYIGVGYVSQGNYWTQDFIAK